jgi:small subunit ribosomal protein S20
MRQGSVRRQRNRAQRSVLRSAVKQVRAAGSGKDAQAAYHEAERMLDRAAQRRLIHPNKAARDKSRLRKLVQSKG